MSRISASLETTRHTALLCLIASLILACANRATAAEPTSPTAKGDGESLSLVLRSRVETFKGSGEWAEVNVPVTLPCDQTAILICDMWDNHWCDAAAARVTTLAKQMDPVLSAARAAGILIVHAPSDTMDFYKDSPARKRARSAPRIEPPALIELADPPLPIDDSDGGCDGPHRHPVHTSVWTREHPAIQIADPDIISDNGLEIYSYLHTLGIKNVIFMGVHTNMCVLGRSFGIRQMARWGIRTILARDLTDAMYDPQDRPFVSHSEGTELVVQHIEKYWGPSMTSEQLLAAVKQASP